MRRRGTGVLLWIVAASLLFAAPSRLAAAEVPHLEADEGRWVLTSLPAILEDEDVERHLTSGLTSSFVFRLDARDDRGSKVESAARVQIRYELWDELFYTATLAIDGSVERRTLTSFEDLSEWWKTLRLAVWKPPPSRPVGKIQVTASFLPFSQSERDDAQRWFSDSLGDTSGSSAEEVTRSVDEPPDRLARAFQLLMATSIRRRALTTYRWTLDPPTEG